MIEKPKLDNARKLRDIYFIDPEDIEFNETMKNAWKKEELPKEAAMSCKVKNHHCIETCGESDTRIFKYACIVEAHECTRKRLERTLPTDLHEDRIAEKGFNKWHGPRLLPNQKGKGKGGEGVVEGVVERGC